MRHEQHLLSEAESRKVIDEVNAWCRRTGTNYNKLVTAARVHVSTRHAVRFRSRRLTIATAQKLRETMSSRPHGIDKDDHKARVQLIARQVVETQRAEVAAVPLHVDRSPCPSCGSRRDLGCVHWERFERGAYA